MTRSLIITNSVYQLLTAIHMKDTILNDIETDLLLTDTTPQLKKYFTRIKDTRVFSRVLFGTTKDLDQKYGNGNMDVISEGFDHIDSVLRWVLNDTLADYSTIYFSNFNVFTRMLACHFYYTPCEFICYEDGFSTYVIDYLREDRATINQHPDGKKIKEKLKKVLLYEPRLAMREDTVPNCALPKMQKDNETLKERLNYIFHYKKITEQADFIFLEQSFRAENIKSNDIELMKECQQTVDSGRFIVKPHPRNPENLPFQLGLTRKYTSDVPWELFLLNEDTNNKKIITVCSNAALTSRIVFGIDLNTIMLYRLFQGKVLWKEDDILGRYLLKFQREFSGKNYYVPETVYELRHILRYLGGIK